MNTETGKIYSANTPAEKEYVQNLIDAGHPIVSVSEKVATQQLAGQKVMTRGFPMNTPRKYQNRSKY